MSSSEKRFIYADNAATTRISADVLDAMMPYLTTEYGNPSSIYALGRNSGFAIEEARAKVAKAIGAKPCCTPSKTAATTIPSSRWTNRA